MKKSWLLLSFFIFIYKVTAACAPNCQSCSSSGAGSCDTCLSWYYRYGSTAPYGCALCMDHCQNCNAPNLCSTCATGYYKNATTSPNACFSCHIIPNCKQCTAANACTTCADNFYTNGTHCRPCPLNCKSCNAAGNCISSGCKNGYYLSSGNCFSCLQNCKSCSSSATCNTCNDGYYYQSTMQLCLPCLIVGCQTCTSDPTECTACFATNYYYNSTEKLCKPCVKNCKICSGTTFCSTCNDGFVLDSTTKTCKACLVGCRSCSLGNIYTYCPACFPVGFVGYSSKCITCTQNCQTCNVNNCTACLDGYYLGNQSPVKLCTACHSSCKGCSAPNASNACTSCYDGFFLENNACWPCHSSCATCSQSTSLDCSSCFAPAVLLRTGACRNCSLTDNCTTCQTYDPEYCLTCTEPYALSGSSCVPCASPCQTCLPTDPTDCVTCVSTHKKFPNRTACYLCSDVNCEECKPTLVTECLKCKTNYTLLSNKACTSCQISCQTCTLATGVCTVCKSGFYLNATLGKCFVCQKGCTTCDATGCLAAQDATVDTAKRIIQCMPGCNSCTSTQTCNGGCYTSNGYYRSSSVCYPCPTGCLQCSSSTYCSTCMANYIRNTTTNLCVTCDENCATCNTTNITKCLSCRSGYQLNANFRCDKSCQLQGCMLCNSGNNQCINCKQGFALKTPDYKCVKCLKSCTGTCDPINIYNCLSCIDSFYLLKNECVRCPRGCKTCDAIQCSACLAGYTSYYDQNGYQLCTPICRYPCLRCQNIVCTSCATGYTLQKSGECLLNTSCTVATPCYQCPRGSYVSQASPVNCTKCVVPNCATCPTGIGCASCLDGFYLDMVTEPANPTCKACAAKCLTCYDIINCFVCMPGYVKEPIDLTNPGSPVIGDNCIPCDANCLTCTVAPDRCQSCGQDMRLINSRCVGVYTVIYQCKLGIDFSSFMLNSQSGDFIAALSKKLGRSSDDNYINYIKQGSTIIGGAVSASSASDAQNIQSGFSNIGGLGYNILSLSSSVYYYDQVYVQKNTERKNNNIGLIIGIAVGSFVFVVLGAVVIYLCVRKYKSKEQHKITIEDVSQGEIDIEPEPSKISLSRRDISPKKRKKKTPKG